MTTQIIADIHALTGIRTQIPVFERVKTFHALDRATTVIGKYTFTFMLFYTEYMETYI
jgi:hypothetical protein